jgi:hypothetical protein
MAAQVDDLTVEQKLCILWTERGEQRESEEKRKEAKAKEISNVRAAIIGMLFTILTHFVMHFLKW